MLREIKSKRQEWSAAESEMMSEGGGGGWGPHEKARVSYCTREMGFVACTRWLSPYVSSGGGRSDTPRGIVDDYSDDDIVVVDVATGVHGVVCCCCRAQRERDSAYVNWHVIPTWRFVTCKQSSDHKLHIQDNARNGMRAFT